MEDIEKGFNPQYDDNKISNNIYVGKKLSNEPGKSYRRVELILDQENSYLTEKNREEGSKKEIFNIKGDSDFILYVSNGGQIKIHCWLIESKEHSKYTTGLHISRRKNKGVYGSQEITLELSSVIALKKYLDKLFIIDTTNPNSFKIPLEREKENRFSKIISEDEFNALIKANINSVDTFYKLLSLTKMENSISILEEIIKGKYNNEVDIQKFLKKNIWMFGNEYGYIVEDEKINSQNILDLIPKNFESYIDIIEVKLPKENLFKYDKSHNNYYSSSKLTKAIAQTQNYIYELEKKSQDIQYQKDNECIIIRPRGIILIGSALELNQDERKYLRILNSSYHNLQIITYQQLLERAKNTIKTTKIEK